MRDAALFIPVIITFVLLFYRLICMGVTKGSRAVRPLRITAVLLVILAIATASISIALALYSIAADAFSHTRKISGNTRLRRIRIPRIRGNRGSALDKGHNAKDRIIPAQRALI